MGGGQGPRKHAVERCALAGSEEIVAAPCMPLESPDLIHSVDSLKLPLVTHEKHFDVEVREHECGDGAFPVFAVLLENDQGVATQRAPCALESRDLHSFHV